MIANGKKDSKDDKDQIIDTVLRSLAS